MVFLDYKNKFNQFIFIMSFRVRDIQSVHNNPLNDSVSKHQYSIPKAERFKYSKS